ncbi:O-succinylbenzoate synthase [Gulosibacter macacae]|uniref:o-succinylbenzoate synthase n=1 Tax=Gulosibacter macacae TaxID=2488791 RepID=A0A3P3VTC1_9MICO|nr:o-succinylbenzoate synthase [Gulosibacter macacae]RRJ86041.1 O-succinylbenzoate synthase [Gulosibacter macacae]
MERVHPSLADLLERAHVVALPLNTRFRGVTEREAVLFAGTEAWSEFSPFLEYAPAEASAWLAAAIEYGFDASLERLDSGTVEVNATVPAVTADAVPQVLARYDGCRVAKVKVAERGQMLADDLARLEAVRDALPTARLRIDANAGWSVPEAVTALRAMTAAGFEFEYVEQPVASVTELAEVRRAVPGVRIAADESVRKAADPLAVARAGAADHVIVKAQPLGGVRRAAEVVAASGLSATVSSALDTSVGIVMGAQLAARLPQPRYAAGLATVSLFAADVVREPRVAVQGQVSLAPAVPDAALLREFAASDACQNWWFERIRACFEHLSTLGAAYSPE